ncbi:sigma-54 interaction domain-containing protein [Paraburkholderia antibiotica]|uniref:Sigma-54-dependent Fis family transcriptional regulator n=1 Tax=Paraburkholderia antibiotica TaxID=2728839 RepID=A0A7X9ZW39_9BURK|nr:sigma-54 dependent transcriptional regulator [Paraburkholderia antibiotica]NML30562.1 sigma-54-dependent Fis family transcriptional regulator [Paraburkholderia antibiotica]
MTAYQGELIGDHPSIAEARRLIGRIAQSRVRSVLIYGETGTGKGLVARMLHQQSQRAQKAFIDLNCAAIPAELVESELFGHEKGAFTGAAAKKSGLIEAANGGTVFLDEIREMDLVLQAKLLSLLDTTRFRRVGAVEPIEVDVRFVAATNKILLNEVKSGRFREDLYYRLQVVSINLPPLRERGDDIFILTEQFIRKFNARYERAIVGLDPEVENIFRLYPWPGNVRELENLLERIFVLEDENRILVKHLPQRITRETVQPRPETLPAEADEQTESETGEASGLSFYEATAQFQRELIQSTLARTNGNQGMAARELGLSRHALRHQMSKLGSS